MGQSPQLHGTQHALLMLVNLETPSFPPTSAPSKSLLWLMGMQPQPLLSPNCTTQFANPRGPLTLSLL